MISSIVQAPTTREDENPTSVEQVNTHSLEYKGTCDIQKMMEQLGMFGPKLTVTWYLEKQAFGTFFETLLPIIFCNLASTLMFFLNSHAANDPDFKYSFNDIIDANLTLGRPTTAIATAR